MSYKRRIESLFQKIQEAEDQKGMHLIVALYGENQTTGKWEVHAQLQSGAGDIETQKTEFDTQEEAEAAVDQLVEKYPGTGKKKTRPAVCNAMNIDYCC